MAKKNNKEKTEANVENIENQVAQEVPEQKAEDKVEPKPSKTGKVEIPDAVDAILKAHPMYKELYIDAKGGVFTPGTPEYIRGKAKLYKNKYFNS